MNAGEELDRALDTIAHAANLVAALQVLAADVVQMGPEDALGAERRDALVGLGDALERALRAGVSAS